MATIERYSPSVEKLKIVTCFFVFNVTQEESDAMTVSSNILNIPSRSAKQEVGYQAYKKVELLCQVI